MQTKREKQREYKLTHWDSDTFRWFYYIILYYVACIPHRISHRSSIVDCYLLYCCRCRCHYLLLSILILILFYYDYYNVNDSRQRIPIKIHIDLHSDRGSWHFAFEPVYRSIKRNPFILYGPNGQSNFKLCTAFIYCTSPMVIDLIKLHWMSASY